jgi:FHS family glucose/mannose:H+ symporter-like MFS transporter
LADREACSARPTGAAADPAEASFTRVAFAAALGAFLLIGAIDAAYGPLLRPVTQRFAVSLPVAGILISINFAGALTGVLCALASFRRATRRPVATFTLSVLCLGCLTVAAARSWALLSVGVFLTGAGFGGTDFSLNNLMARTRARGRAARLTVLNAAFGAGAVGGPAAVNALGGRVLTVGFAVAAAGACAAAAGVLGISAGAPAGTTAPAADGPAGSPTAGTTAAGTTAAGSQAAGSGAAGSGARWGRWPRAGVALVALAYLLYVGCESGVAGWIPAHLEALGYSPHLATDVTSGFWGAMTVGRLAMVPVSRTLAAHRIVLAACPLLTLALALTTVRTIAPGCYVVAGFAAAPIFPIGLDWIVAAFSGYRPATSWALTGSFAGGVAGPAVVAGVVSVAGVHAVPAVLTAFAAATFLAFLAVSRERPRLLTEVRAAP